ncbi:MAG TPA: glycosyltransferase [Acidimicrobiia bacterium]
MRAPDVTLVAPYPADGVLHAGRSGVASYTANLARSLDAQGARVVVIADRAPGQPSRSHDGRIGVMRTFPRGPLALPRALVAAQGTGAPVVHLQHELFLYGGASSIPGLVPGLMGIRAPLVVTMHQVVDPSAIDGDFTRLHRVRVPAGVARLGISGVQTVVRARADTVIVHEPMLAAQIDGAIVVPHGVERVQRVERNEARRALGLGDEFIVLCFGYVAPYKGLDAAIAAAAVTASRVRVVVAGGEHPRLAGRDRYADGIRASAGDRVRFTGHVPEDDVRLWFSAADVALLPYPRPYSSSGALALALAYRTPALLSRELAECIGAASAMTVDREPRALAERLDALATRPELLAEVADATASLARDRSWPLVAARHLDVYEEVIRGHGATGRRVRAMQSG